MLLGNTVNQTDEKVWFKQQLLLRSFHLMLCKHCFLFGISHPCFGKVSHTFAIYVMMHIQQMCIDLLLWLCLYIDAGSMAWATLALEVWSIHCHSLQLRADISRTGITSFLCLIEHMLKVGLLPGDLNWITHSELVCILICNNMNIITFALLWNYSFND